nr:DUF3307 domain-containing protein [Roseivivax marinus]
MLAHGLADFVLQTDAMVAGKGRLRVAALHAASVAALTFLVVAAPNLAALGTALAVTAVHIAIDRIKQAVGDTLGPFLADQAAHLATLGAAALVVPTLWADGVWAALLPEGTAPALAYLAFGLIAVRAGRFAVGKTLATIGTDAEIEGIAEGSLKDAGARIGELERLLTYALVVTGNTTGVAFLVAAKSILRFDATRDDRASAEYIIVGTLASIAWALGAAFLAILLIGDTP